MTQTIGYELVYINLDGRRNYREVRSLDEIKRIIALYPDEDILEVNKIEKTPMDIDYLRRG